MHNQHQTKLPLEIWLKIVLNEIAASDVYLQLGIYALAYVERSDLSSDMQQISAQIFTSIQHYYDEHIILPLLRKRLDELDDKLDKDSIIRETRIFILKHALCRSEAKDDPHNNYDMVRRTWNAYFFTDTLTELRSKGVSDNKILTTIIYRKHHLYFSDVVADHFYYFKRLSASMPYQQTCLGKNYLELKDEKNKALRFAWATYLSSISTTFSLPKDSPLVATDDTSVTAIIKKFTKKEDPKISGKTEHSNIHKTIFDGFKNVFYNADLIGARCVEPLYIMSAKEIYQLRIGPSSEAVYPTVAAPTSQTMPIGPSPAPTATVPPRTFDYEELKKMRIRKINLKIIFELKAKINDPWLTRNPLYLFLLKYNTSDPRILPNSNLVDANLSLEEKLAAILFVPLCLLNQLQHFYDQCICYNLKAVSQDLKNKIRAISTLISKLHDETLPQIVKAAIQDNRPKLAIFLKSLDTFFTEEIHFLFNLYLRKFHNSAAGSTPFWKLLTAERLAHICAVTKPELTQVKRVSNNFQIPHIFRTENLASIIISNDKEILEFDFFQDQTFSQPDWVPNPLDPTFTSQKDTYYRVPLPFQYVAPANVWNLLCLLIKAKLKENEETYYQERCEAAKSPSDEVYQRLTALNLHASVQQNNIFPLPLTETLSSPTRCFSVSNLTEQAIPAIEQRWLDAYRKLPPKERIMPAATQTVLPAVSISTIPEPSALSSPAGAAQPVQRQRPSTRYTAPAIPAPIVQHVEARIEYQIEADKMTTMLNLSTSLQLDQSEIFSRIYLAGPPEHIHYFYVPNARDYIWRKEPELRDMLTRCLATRHQDTYGNSRSLVAIRGEAGVSYKVRILGHSSGKGDIRYMFTEATIINKRIAGIENVQIFVLSEVVNHAHNRYQGHLIKISK